MSQPPTIPYSSQPHMQPRVRFPILKFFLGPLLGCCISAAVFFPAINHPSQYQLYLLVTPLVLKVSVGATLMMWRDLRPFGLGLIVSVPLVVLLFFVGCAIAVAGHV